MDNTWHFPLRFDTPAWLLLLFVLLPFIWRMGKNSLAGLSTFRKISSIGLRMLLVAALTIALARPQINRASDDVTVCFVVDISDSIPSEQANHIDKVISKATEGKPVDDKVGLIYFGANAACEWLPSNIPPPIGRQSVIERDGTNIAEALRLASYTFPRDYRKRIVLVSDGNQNQSDAFPEVERLRSFNICMDVLPIEYKHDRELMVEKVTLPERVQPGIKFVMRVMVQSSLDTDAELSVKSGSQVIKKSRVRINKGKNVFSVPVKLNERNTISGIRTFSATVVPLNLKDDHIHNNNTASSYVRIIGPPSILYVDGNLENSEGYKPFLQETLLKNLRLLHNQDDGRDAKITLHVCDAYNVPKAEELISYDCIILDNVPADSLGHEKMERIRSLVNSQGTGLIMIGGENSFGMGNYRNTPIEAALPVDMDLKNKKVAPNGALMLAIDCSGSMSGNKIEQAKAAAWAAAKTLAPYDYIGIIAFDGMPQWLVKPTQANDKHAIRNRIASLSPGGGTDIMAALQESHKALIPIRAAVKHIILLSDGQSYQNGLPELMRQMKKHKITVSTVGIGEREGQELMEEIARRGDGRFHYVSDPRKLPKIFIKESMYVKRALINEETFRPLITDGSDEIIREVNLASMPPLHGFIVTTAKPAANVPLKSLTEDKDPILAHWRYGLGRTAAFTSDAKNRWGKEWLSWNEFANFWGGIVYQSLRQEPTNLKMFTSIDGNEGKVVVHANDKFGKPLPFLDLTASVMGPKSSTQKIILHQTGISTYEGSFNAEKHGRYELAVTESGKPDGGSSRTYGGVVRSIDDEHRNFSANIETLTRLAQMGGGKVLSSAINPKSIFSPESLPATADFRSCWQSLLWLVLLLFPLDVFLRRVMIDFTTIRRWLAEKWLNWKGQPAAREERVALLMEAKRKAFTERSTPVFLDKIQEGRNDNNFSFENSSKPDFTPQESSPTSQKPAVTVAPETKNKSKMSYTERLLQAKKRSKNNS